MDITTVREAGHVRFVSANATKQARLALLRSRSVH